MSEDKRIVAWASSLAAGTAIGRNASRLWSHAKETNFWEEIAIFGLCAYLVIVIMTFTPKLKRRIATSRVR